MTENGLNVASDGGVQIGVNAMLHAAHLLRLRLCISSRPVVPCKPSALALGRPPRIRVSACRAGFSSFNSAMEGSGRDSEVSQVAVIGAGGGFLCLQCTFCLPIVARTWIVRAIFRQSSRIGMCKVIETCDAMWVFSWVSRV